MGGNVAVFGEPVLLCAAFSGSVAMFERVRE